MQVRREILGNQHVNKAIKNTNSIDKRFQEFITEGAWGNVWSGNKLSKRDRSLITVAILASLGHSEELEMHINATKNKYHYTRGSGNNTGERWFERITKKEH